MKLKTAKDACQEALIRRGFKKHNGDMWRLRLGNKSGEVYDVWFPRDGYRGDWFVRIDKGTVGGSKTISWVDWTNKIILRLV